MGKIGDLWVRLGLKKDEFTAGLDKAGKESQTFSQKVGGAFAGIASKALALTAAIATIGRAIGGGIRAFKNFEQANSELAAVLGTTLDGIKGLSDSAKDLGSTTRYTASEVTQLQIALARLGFDTGQITAMQKSVLNFATAMGTDLGSAAEFTGSALRAFGLQATDTGALLDVMSASTTHSALNFSKLQSSISVVGPIAKAFGLDVKETASFLGVLSNSGFDASSAATALRNILLNLADSNGKLAKGIGHSARTFPEIIAAFEELRKKGVDVGAILEMTDRRSASAAAALISMGGDVAKLKGELDDAEGSLNTMAGTMEDNFAGAIASVKSAWEGLMLSLNSNKGILKEVTSGLADFIRMFYGQADFQVSRRETRDLINGIKANNYAATLTNGGTLSRKEQREYNKLREAGYITPNAFQEQTMESWFKEGKEFYKLARRSNEYGLWGDWEKIQLTTEEVKEYKKYLESINNTSVTPKDVDDAEEAMKRLKAAAKEAADEATRVRQSDDEVLDLEAENYKRFQQQHGLTGKAPVDNGLLLAQERQLMEAIEIGEELEDLGPRLAASLDECAQRATADLAKMQEAAEELNKALAEQLVSAIQDGLVGAFNALADVIGGVTDGDMTAVAKALLEPLADMAIKAGTIIMMTGTAIESLKEGLINFFGGSPVVAGAALIGVGLAAKAGLAALGNRGSSGAGVSSYSSSGAAYGGANGVSTAELVVRVEGEVKGSSIVLSGQNTLKNWNR